MSVDHSLILNVVEKVLDEKLSFPDLPTSKIKALSQSFIESGLSGELTGKPWSQRYAKMQGYYLKKYLSESESLGFEAEPISPLAIRKVINFSNRGTSEKRARHAALVSLIKFLVLNKKLPKSQISEVQELRPKNYKPPKKRFITEDELKRIIFSIKESHFTNEYSRLLMITVLTAADELGIRVGELCNIQLNHLDLEKQELFIPKAKGNKEFTKGITTELKVAIEKYLKHRPRTECLNLFVQESGKPLLRDTLIQRFRRITKKLGLDTSFHAIRRRYITRHLQDGKSLVDVSLAVGHSSPRMTEQYLLPDVQKSIEEQKKW